MSEMALILVQTGVVGVAGVTEVARCGDEEVGFDDGFEAVGDDGEDPFSLLFGPVGARDRGVVMDVFLGIVLLGDLFPVFLDLGAGGVVLGPGCLRRKGALVDVAWDVTFDARIFVGVPRSSLGNISS
jgi:hypothetical protein